MLALNVLPTGAMSCTECDRLSRLIELSSAALGMAESAERAGEAGLEVNAGLLGDHTGLARERHRRVLGEQISHLHVHSGVKSVN